MKCEFSAIILASGKSNRFKYGNKLKLMLNGKKVVEYVMDEIKKSKRFKEILIVSSYDEILLLGRQKGIIPIKNIYDNEGISSSIKLGVENSNYNYMFFVADQPYINEALINKLIDKFDGEHIIVPTYNGELKNPVIFPYEFKNELLKLKGDIGGKKIITSNEEKVKKVKVDDEKYFKDIDTAQDYYKMEKIVIVRGAGDIATGVIQKLFRAGFKVLSLEKSNPSSIRRTVSLSQCMYDDEASVEDMIAKKISKVEDAFSAWNEGKIPVLDDQNCMVLNSIKPIALVDAIIAKKNLGTNKNMAPITIGLGPGFTAPTDVDIVIETFRGHDLGRLIFKGRALDDTRTPGKIDGVSLDRVIYSNASGKFKSLRKIGDKVQKDEIIAEIIDNEKVATIKSKINGILRGIIQDGFLVTPNFKVADVDPRIDEQKNCFTISDKARSIGGAVLEAIIYLERMNLSEK